MNARRWNRGMVTGAWITVLTALIGCHHGDGHRLDIDVDIPTLVDINADVEGTWDASLTYASGRIVRATLILEQPYWGDWQVFGTLRVDGSAHDVDGTITGRALHLHLFPRTGCDRAMEFIGSVDGDGWRIQGTLVGETCDGESGRDLEASRR